MTCCISVSNEGGEFGRLLPVSRSEQIYMEVQALFLKLFKNNRATMTKQILKLIILPPPPQQSQCPKCGHRGLNVTPRQAPTIIGLICLSTWPPAGNAVLEGTVSPVDPVVWSPSLTSCAPLCFPTADSFRNWLTGSLQAPRLLHHGVGVGDRYLPSRYEPK